MSFGARLAETRRQKKLTQEQLGRGLGTDGKDVTKAVVSGWEQDQHSPRADQLRMICERLGCSADFLLLGVASSGSLSPELSQLAAAIEQLSPRWREWLLMNMREAVKLAREADEPVTQKHDDEPSVPHKKRNSR
jgi:transcriptional regulator with XRE-family HTH domain